MTIATLNAYRDAALAAMAAADWDAAITNWMAVQGMISANPNITRGLAGGGSQAISWNPSQIPELIAQCRRMKASAVHATSGPFVRVPVTYIRPTASEDYS